MPSQKLTTPTTNNIKPNRPPTTFEKRVYEATSAIPRGRVSTYGEVAKFLGSSPRAVGGALKRNPFAPAVPCHRVVAAGGSSLGGFSGTWGATPETARKLRMLVEEGVETKKKGREGGEGVEILEVMSAAELGDAVEAARATAKSSRKKE